MFVRNTVARCLGIIIVPCGTSKLSSRPSNWVRVVKYKIHSNMKWQTLFKISILTTSNLLTFFIYSVLLWSLVLILHVLETIDFRKFQNAPFACKLTLTHTIFIWHQEDVPGGQCRSHRQQIGNKSLELKFNLNFAKFQVTTVTLAKENK